MRKVISVILSCCLILSLVSCSGKKEVSNTTAPTATPLPTATVAATPTPSVEPTATPNPDPDNLLVGGDFTVLDRASWGLYKESRGDGSFDVNADGQLEVKVNDNGTVQHAMQIFSDGFELLQNGKYELTFDVVSSVPRTMEWRVQINGGDYHAYASDEKVKLTTEMQHMKFEFTMKEPSDLTPRFCLNLGLFEGDGQLAAHTICFDNIRLVLKDNSQAVSAEDVNKEIPINVNQVGYLAKDTKTAIFRDSAADTEFTVVDAKTEKVVYTGKVADAKDSASAKEKVAYGDFSSVTTPGTYKIKAQNAGESSTFVIGDEAYNKLFDDVVKMFYLQRCGMELTKEYAGDFAHGACHADKATMYYSKKKIDVSGGWHDAGDYGRYTVAGAKAAADLLLAYEEYGKVFGDSVGIPESGNKVPDVLDEARYELEWLLKMQNSESGGVYHKVTGLNFEASGVMPQEVKDEMFVLPESTCATGDFIAVMAMASRIYKSYDEAFAAKCLAAAKKALPYMEKHLGQSGYTNPTDVLTGEYPDTENKDEYLWALCELFKTTGDSSYNAKIGKVYLEGMENGLGWASVNLYGCFAYLTAQNQDATVANKLKAKFSEYFDSIKANTESDGYNSSMGEVYPWGSNMTIANNGIVFLMAKKVLQQDSSAFAKEQLDYLLGANTTSYCFVTGYGTVTPEDVHHRPSEAKEKAMKGMLVGGPDSKLEDPFAKKVLADKPAAKCYADNVQSYSCNEITIYWNSPLVYLLAGVEAGK